MEIDYTYFTKWEFDHLFKDYDGSDGFLILYPWIGGFNNVRQSLELSICLSYLTNRTLVLPEQLSINPLSGLVNFSDFFDINNFGIKTILMSEFCSIKKIDSSSIEKISRVLQYDYDLVVNFEDVPVPKSFLKGRKFVNVCNLFDNSDAILLNKNLLGIFYQTIYTSFDKELKMLIANHVRYKKEVFDIAWKFIDMLGDKKYYSIHIRRSDFIQYDHLFISGKKVLENVKDTIPPGSTVYISTDHKDKGFFKSLKSKYNVIFYGDLTKKIDFDFDINLIPMIEQLICTRGIKFVGMQLSTFSSYIFRMRGYMSDIEDKNYYINTEIFRKDSQIDFIEEVSGGFNNWSREYKDGWDFNKETIFVSIAAYCDTQIFPTIKNMLEEAWRADRLTVGVCLQDSKDVLEKLLLAYPKLKIKHVLPDETLGLGWARDVLKTEIYKNEDYFFQIDSHSRFKKNWDNIIVNQHKSLPTFKSIISTHPNGFDIPDKKKEYLNKSRNCPLFIKKLLNNNEYDNRCKPGNRKGVKKYEIQEGKYCGGGFLFAPKEWVMEVRVPHSIFFNGEEEYMTFQGYLKGWTIYVPSEAIIWHNYNYKNKNTGEPYRVTVNKIKRLQKDESVFHLNHLLFKEHHERTLEECENYFDIKFRVPSDDFFDETDETFIPKNDTPSQEKDSRKCRKKSEKKITVIEKLIKINKSNMIKKDNVKKRSNNIQLRKIK